MFYRVNGELLTEMRAKREREREGGREREREKETVGQKKTNINKILTREQRTNRLLLILILISHRLFAQLMLH
jgi:hypothetical protein